MRMKFNTIADMTAAPISGLYDGCLTYVVSEKKYYSYDSSNVVDPELGKCREFSSGGGGSGGERSASETINNFDFNKYTNFNQQIGGSTIAVITEEE